MIPRDLFDFIHSGVSMLVGTRDARLCPEAMRAVGARVEADGARLTVFVPEATGARTLANALENGRVAMCCSRPADHKTIQVKGRLLEVAPTGPEERALVERYRFAFAATLAEVGLPQRVTLRLAHWPCHALRIAVESVFVQTPGPGAGEPLGPGAGADPR